MADLSPLRRVVFVALLFGTMRSLAVDATHRDVAIGGLNLATLLFAACCLLMEQTTPRVIVICIAFYAWGFAVMALGDATSWGLFSRLLLSVPGIALVAWACLSPGYREMMATVRSHPSGTRD